MEKKERKERSYGGRAFNGANPFHPEKREPISRQWQPDKNLIPPQGFIQFLPQNGGKIPLKTSTGRFGAREKPLAKSRNKRLRLFLPFFSRHFFALLFYTCMFFFCFVLLEASSFYFRVCFAIRSGFSSDWDCFVWNIKKVFVILVLHLFTFFKNG